uniref:C2H2-type domain-containing protein n=1 Tax=Glossina palpalis gambiensis TaxID=67801 RepID=A0A1B0B7G4_9MUSC
METQNSNQNPTADGAAPATKDGGNSNQEVSSTTQNIEPTKRSLRVQTWRKLQENKYGVGFNRIFNRIPDFVNSDKAALMLAETDEFKNATNIKIMIDRALHVAKFQALLANKNLYLPGTRDSKALYLKVDVPPNATDEQKKEILNVQDVQNHRTEISLDTKIKLDMVVIGSVVVSRDGYRIGRGNGFNDLDIGLLTETGALTPETIIVTLVHDAQVVDNLPTNLFQKYDTPVDLIVTPTEVIHVDKRLPRPTGIFWELLSERRLKIIPVLQVLKETLEKEGKVITLKEIDTDIEQSQKGRRRGMMRRRYGNRRYQRRAISQTDTEQQQGENTEQRRFPRRRRFINRRRRPTKSEGDQSGIESMSQERRAGGGGGDGGNRRSRPRKNRPVLDFSIKVTNLRRGMRIKDLKAELRKRQCNPLGITWKEQIDNLIDNIAIKTEPQFDGENQLLKSVEKDAETNNQSSAQSIAQNERYKAFHVEKCLQIKMEVENFESPEKDLKQIDNWIDNIAIKTEPQFDGENQLLKSVEKDAETNNQSSAQSIAQNERYKAFHVEKCLQIKMEVENFESPEKDLKQIDNWIDNIAIKNEPQFDGENQLLKSVEKDAEANYQASAKSVVQNESTHLPKELKMSCPNCGSRRCNMYADMRTFHGQEPLDVLLNNSNTTQYKLQAHVKSEHGSKTDENNEMESNSGLVANEEGHQKSKKIKYKCTVCEKAFKRRKKFKSHMRAHANERPYKCPHCERSFLQSRFLNMHICTHMERRPIKSEGDQSGIESMTQVRRAVGGGRDGGNRRQRSRKNRPVLDFSIKVTNLKRGMRIKDFKAELRKRQCNPLGITWKASIGRCFLHFGNRNGQPSTDEDVEKVLNALSNLTLTINPPRNDNAPNANGAEGDVGEPSPQSKPPKTINLNVKLIKRNEKKKVGGNNEVNGDDAAGGDASNARIESVDATPV